MPSITGALRGETLLTVKGIYVRVIKLPAGTTKKGCAYGLEMNGMFINEAVRILEENNVKHGEVLY